MEINRTVPIKLKISFLLLRNEKDCTPSSKYQIASAIIVETIINTIGNIRQQSFLFFICLKLESRHKNQDTRQEN